MKNIHPVYGAGIRTHHLLNMIRLSLSLDQGFRPINHLFNWRTPTGATRFGEIPPFWRNLKILKQFLEGLVSVGKSFELFGKFSLVQMAEH